MDFAAVTPERIRPISRRRLYGIGALLGRNEGYNDFSTGAINRDNQHTLPDKPAIPPVQIIVRPTV